MIWAIATSVNHKGRGVGLETLSKTLEILHVKKGELDLDCAVFTRIHCKNVASQALFRSAGFEHLGADPLYEGLEAWVIPA